MRVVVVFLLLISSVRADQQQLLSGAQWLKKIDVAMKTLSYQGTAVFLKNGQLEIMKYQHGFENGTEFERLSSLNSPLREVIRKASEISCHFKESSKTVGNHQAIDRSMILNLPAAPELLDGQYLLAATGREMVAMRPAQLIAVLPKDDLRYARKIWIDSQTYLPLKVQVYSAKGETLEEVVFTEMTSAAGEVNVQSAEQSQHLQHHHLEDAAAFEQSAFKLQSLPDGYKIVFFAPNTLQKSQAAVDRLLLSDGFANISIYFENKTPQSTEGLRSFGSVNSFSRIIGDYQITALGEVPAKTVELIVNGVTLR